MCLRGLAGLALGYAPLDTITVEAVRQQAVQIVLVVRGGVRVTAFILVEKTELAINYRGIWLLLNYGEEEFLGGVEYDIQPDIMAYATYARGYKGPTFDQLNGHLVNPQTQG